MNKEIRIGRLRKVDIDGENFHVKINMVHEGLVYATVRNNLVAYAIGEIDFTFGDSIVFRMDTEEIVQHTAYQIFPRGLGGMTL